MLIGVAGRRRSLSWLRGCISCLPMTKYNKKNNRQGAGRTRVLCVQGIRSWQTISLSHKDDARRASSAIPDERRPIRPAFRATQALSPTALRMAKKSLGPRQRMRRRPRSALVGRPAARYRFHGEKTASGRGQQRMGYGQFSSNTQRPMLFRPGTRPTSRQGTTPKCGSRLPHGRRRKRTMVSGYPRGDSCIRMTSLAKGGKDLINNGGVWGTTRVGLSPSRRGVGVPPTRQGFIKFEGEV